MSQKKSKFDFENTRRVWSSEGYRGNKTSDGRGILEQVRRGGFGKLSKNKIGSLLSDMVAGESFHSL